MNYAFYLSFIIYFSSVIIVSVDNPLGFCTLETAPFSDVYIALEMSPFSDVYTALEMSPFSDVYSTWNCAHVHSCILTPGNLTIPRSFFLKDTLMKLQVLCEVYSRFSEMETLIFPL